MGGWTPCSTSSGGWFSFTFLNFVYFNRIYTIQENWKVSINFIVENQQEDAAHIKALANVVKIPQRKLFSYIHKDDLMELINEIGNPKTRKIKDLPLYFEITEVIKGLMDAGEDIPIHLWGKLIKFSVLNIKDKDVKRRETESKSKDEKEKGGKGSGWLSKSCQ